MPGRPRVGLIVDHPKRDLAGAVLLARALVRRDLEAVLIPQYEQAVDVPLLGLDALVINYARPVNQEIVRDFARSGIAVYVLDTEGGVLADDGPSTPAKLASYIAESGYADLLAGYFFWGPVLREAFVSAGVLAADRLHLTGCPRFDFAAPSLRETIAARRSGHVLVNTNYPAVNPRFVTGTGDDKAALRSVGYGEAYIEQLLADTRAIMAGMIATVQRLAGECPGRRFVLRPHPFEDDAVYASAFADHANVEVDGDGDVLEALQGARALLHVNCGTAIEAIMLEVPPLSLEFLNTSHMGGHASLPSRASLPVESFGDLAEMIGGARPIPPFDFAARHARFVEPWFYRNDGLAAGRVAEVLAGDIARRGERVAPSLGRSLAASRRRPSGAQRGQAALANLAGSLASSRLRALVQPRRSDKMLELGAIRRLLARLGEAAAAPIEARRARHPLTKASLASVVIGARSGALQPGKH